MQILRPLPLRIRIRISREGTQESVCVLTCSSRAAFVYWSLKNKCSRTVIPKSWCIDQLSVSKLFKIVLCLVWENHPYSKNRSLLNRNRQMWKRMSKKSYKWEIQSGELFFLKNNCKNIYYSTNKGNYIHKYIKASIIVVLLCNSSFSPMIWKANA